MSIHDLYFLINCVHIEFVVEREERERQSWWLHLEQTGGRGFLCLAQNCWVKVKGEAVGLQTRAVCAALADSVG